VRMNHRRIGQRSRPRAKISRPRERINLRLVRISRPPIRPLARINRLPGRTSHRREQVSLRQTGKRRRRTGLSLRRTKTHRNRRRLQKPTSRTRHRKRRSRPKIKRTRKRNLRARNLAGYGRSAERRHAAMGTACAMTEVDLPQHDNGFSNNRRNRERHLFLSSCRRVIP